MFDISVDYAKFETTRHAAVIAVDFAWSDLGSWEAVWINGNKDADGNVVTGPVTLSKSASCWSSACS